MSRPGRERAAAFSHPDGDAALVSLIATCVKPCATMLVKDGPEDVYPSTEMKSGISSEKLKEYETLLSSLMEIDPRGGFYRQAHVCVQH